MDNFVNNWNEMLQKSLLLPFTFAGDKVAATKAEKVFFSKLTKNAWGGKQGQKR